MQNVVGTTVSLAKPYHIYDRSQVMNRRVEARTGGTFQNYPPMGKTNHFNPNLISRVFNFNLDLKT